MKATHVRGLFLAFLVLLTCLIGSVPVQAQEPERRTEMVYGVNASIGDAYEGTFYPQDHGRLYILADTISIVSPRMTQVYYWPITNELVADWDTQNDVVEGILEIRRRGRIVQKLEPADYVIQYPDGRDSSQAQLYLDERAHQQWAYFEQVRDQFRQDVSAYYQDLVNYRQDLDAQIAAGELTGEPPAPPVEPAPFVFSSTEINNGFPVNLPPGRYSLQVRNAQGQVVPSSRRQLEVFAPVAQGVAYSVIPHDRYTFPELSDDVGEVIYLRDNTQVYLRPFTQLEFPDLHLTRVREPQATTGRPDLYRWHQQWEIEEGTLVITAGRTVLGRVERRPYAIRQITGAALGYEIHDQTTTEIERLRERRPAFHGFWLDAATLPSSFRIHLEDEDGLPVAGSQRRVRTVRTSVPSWSLGLSSLPFVAALLITTFRRRRFSRLPRELE